MSGPFTAGHKVFNTDLNPILLGWVDFSWFGSTLAYVSADAPTFVFSVNADVTALVEPGMRVKLTQTTDKFFIVTAVGAFSAGVTPITVYGGTDYTLANAAITAGSFSTHKKPFGFNASPAKWTETLRDTTDRTQAAAAAGSWYNPGSLSLSIPIGVWDVDYRATDQQSTGALGPYVSLSTANNSASDTDFTTNTAIGGTGSTTTKVARKTLTIAAKTSYFLVISTGSGATPTIGFYASQFVSPTIVRARCAYL